MKDFRKIFKEEAQAKTLTKVHVIQRAILQAMEYYVGLDEAVNYADWYIRRAFTPITRKVKLDNGREPYDTVTAALQFANWDVMRFFESGVAGLNEYVRFREILAGLVKKYTKPYDYNNRYYFYVFVRQDISPEYQAVQVCHAAAKMGSRNGTMAWENFDKLYITLVGVPDIKGLETAIADIKEVGGTAYEFREPDIGNELTAVASSPILAANRKRLLSYKRLKFGV